MEQGASVIVDGARSVVLAHDAAIDRTVVSLYRAEGPWQRARLLRDLDRERGLLRIALDMHPVFPGDLRR